MNHCPRQKSSSLAPVATSVCSRHFPSLRRPGWDASLPSVCASLICVLAWWLLWRGLLSHRALNIHSMPFRKCQTPDLPIPETLVSCPVTSVPVHICSQPATPSSCCLYYTSLFLTILTPQIEKAMLRVQGTRSLGHKFSATGGGHLQVSSPLGECHGDPVLVLCGQGWSIWGHGIASA